MDNLNNCPNCGQPVEPDDKFCRNCGQPFPERQPEVPPAPIPPEAPTAAPEVPSETKYIIWENRQNVGFFKALWETWKESVFYPDKFFGHLPFSGGLWSPIIYAVIIGWFYFAVGAVYDLLFSSFWLRMIPQYIDSANPLIGLSLQGATLASFLITFFSAPLIVIIILFVESGIYHLIAMIFGWTNREYEASLRAVAYSAGPLAFAILPFCGQPISLVWALVVTIIGFKHMQKTAAGKAALTVLLPWILCCCLLFLVALIFGTAILALIKGSSAGDYNF